MLLDQGSLDLKVIAHLRDQVVCGFVARDQWHPASELLRLRPLDSSVELEICVEDALAVYVVHTFEGNPQQESILFHKFIEPKERIWVRVILHNGEEMEGLIDNGPQFLLASGFWMNSCDPASNNIAVYLPKHSVRNFQVLGTRSYRTH